MPLRKPTEKELFVAFLNSEIRRLTEERNRILAGMPDTKPRKRGKRIDFEKKFGKIIERRKEQEA